eukprot:TRINITY_DN7740_c0_g2_i1.p1 TRINITY_DN7740_c0_g2~~TRINITY_DN7740_c0_g2_i1.p1  ORF type:complete len:178 (-),score=19.59 TRINITY_DN7740_c0_g2_i1:248-781(-)
MDTSLHLTQRFKPYQEDGPLFLELSSHWICLLFTIYTYLYQSDMPEGEFLRDVSFVPVISVYFLTVFILEFIKRKNKKVYSVVTHPLRLLQKTTMTYLGLTNMPAVELTTPDARHPPELFTSTKEIPELTRIFIEPQLSKVTETPEPVKMIIEAKARKPTFLPIAQIPASLISILSP